MNSETAGVGPVDATVGPAAEARYCYSTDEETFYGDFSSREDAVAAAAESLEGQDEPGEKRKVYTAVKQHPTIFLEHEASRIGEHFVEWVDEWMCDYIAADDYIVRVADKAAFGAALVGLLRQHATFHSFNADNITEHEVTVPGEPEKPNAGSVAGEAACR